MLVSFSFDSNLKWYPARIVDCKYIKLNLMLRLTYIYLFSHGENCFTSGCLHTCLRDILEMESKVYRMHN